MSLQAILHTLGYIGRVWAICKFNLLEVTCALARRASRLNNALMLVRDSRYIMPLDFSGDVNVWEIDSI